MTDNVVLGIDTSCYTTSAALVSSDGRIVSDVRKPLDVPEGGRGLQQSKAVFQHISCLSDLIGQALDMAPKSHVRAVAVSAAPRPQPGSYMPVFVPGERTAAALARALCVPLLRTTHQQGHLRAGLYPDAPDDQQMIAMHISGGTTELLKVTPQGPELSIELLGGGSDLKAGQLVDRVGVALGLAFPAGPALEKLALETERTERLPVFIDGLQISFSGTESHLQRAIRARAIEPPVLARSLFKCMADAFSQVLGRACAQAGANRALIVGGVAENGIIRRSLLERLDIDVRFSKPGLSGDNAVGVALLGLDRYSNDLI